MNEIQTFAKLLRIRTLMKRVNQLSWSLQKFERKYPDLEEYDEEQQLSLLEGYKGFADEIMNIYENLKNEFESKK